jgi:hypothetical protein
MQFVREQSRRFENDVSVTQQILRGDRSMETSVDTKDLQTVAEILKNAETVLLMAGAGL